MSVGRSSWMGCVGLLVKQFTNMHFDDGNRSGFSGVLDEGERDSYIIARHFRNVGNDQPQRQVVTVRHIASAIRPFPIVRRRERFLICSWDRSTIRCPARSRYQLSYPGYISQYVVWILLEITNRCNWMQWILFVCLVHSTCFGRHTRPSSGVQLYLQPLVQS